MGSTTQANNPKPGEIRIIADVPFAGNAVLFCFLTYRDKYRHVILKPYP